MTSTVNQDQEYQNRCKHFAVLKEKYQVTEYEDISPSSPLYFILRKVELGIELDNLEFIWLQKQNLVTICELIRQKQQYNSQERINLGVEFTKLKSKYKATNYNISWTASPLYFILCKIDSGDLLTLAEDNWLISHGLSQTKLISLETQRFINLKSKYKASQYKDNHPDSPLYQILKKIDIEERLTHSEYQWLIDKELLETLEFVKQQESKRRDEFAQLKLKYQANKYKNKTLSNPLYPILQKLEIEEKLLDSEIAWLEEQGLRETIAIFQELEQTKEFAALKFKYKATKYEDSSPKCHLYKVLKLIDSGNCLHEQDINFLQKRDLNETIQIANDKYASYLRTKIGTFDFFNDSHIHWLQKNGYEQIIRTANEQCAYQLKSKIESLHLLNDLEINWLKLNKYQKIIILMEAKHFDALKSKYGVLHYKDRSFNSPLYTILKKLDKEERIEPTDVAWLQENKIERHQTTYSYYGWQEDHQHEGSSLFSGKILIAYHTIEANFYHQEFKRTDNKWNLANASSHWRKAQEPEKALQLTNNLEFDKIKENKLKSALLTSRGGAFRDIGNLDKAEDCARKAIEYQPKSHHPYTLMGAICFQRHEYLDGEYWFKEAIKRGANPRDIDSEIKKVVKNAKDENKRREVIEYLLKKDSHRYAWAKAYLKKQKDKK